MVDGIAAASALPQNLAVFELGYDVFNAGCDRPVRPVVVIVDDPAGVVGSGCGDGVDAAVAAVTEDAVVVAPQEVGDGCAGDDDVVAVSRASSGRR